MIQKGNKMIKKSDIEKEIAFVDEHIKTVSNELSMLTGKVPNGAKLRSAKHGTGYQYFMRIKPSDINGEYIKAKNRKQAIILAQIEYDENLLKRLRKALSALKIIKKNCSEEVFESTLNDMPPGKCELIKLPYLSDRDYILKWKNTDYIGLDFSPDYPEYYTRQNLRVRSKSEVIIADILDEYGVPFLYEKPLHLKSGLFHPDFTLLNIKTRKELYWEHLGMMDDIDYRNNAFQKLRNYESCGLYPYESVIWTFETGKYPLNTKEIRKMVKQLKITLGYE